MTYQKRMLMLCGSCLGIAALHYVDEGLTCPHCGAQDCEGPCWCEGCREQARDLLAGQPMQKYQDNKAVPGSWQRGVNWTRRGVVKE